VKCELFVGLLPTRTQPDHRAEQDPRFNACHPGLPKVWNISSAPFGLPEGAQNRYRAESCKHGDQQHNDDVTIHGYPFWETNKSNRGARDQMLNSSIGYPRLGMGNSVSSHTGDAMNGTARAHEELLLRRVLKSGRAINDSYGVGC